LVNSLGKLETIDHVAKYGPTFHLPK